MFVISWSASPLQALQPSLIFVGKATGAYLRVEHLKGWLYPQTLDYTIKACERQTL